MSGPEPLPPPPAYKKLHNFKIEKNREKKREKKLLSVLFIILLLDINELDNFSST